MIKSLELSDPLSCMNRAKPDEETFVLLGRDPAMPATLRYWCDIRIEMGKNKVSDEQIMSTLRLANKLEGR